jgi:hypothetical protein
MAGSVTSKGQVTIPKRVREALGITPGSKVESTSLAVAHDSSWSRDMRLQALKRAPPFSITRDRRSALRPPAPSCATV